MSLANVISRAKLLPGGNPSPFPAMYWRADGSVYVAATAAEIEPDTTPYHPNSAPDHDALNMTKAEVIQHLTAGGIPFKANKSLAALYALLLEGVKNALVADGIQFDPTTADAKALLELFPKE